MAKIEYLNFNFIKDHASGRFIRNPGGRICLCTLDCEHKEIMKHTGWSHYDIRSDGDSGIYTFETK